MTTEKDPTIVDEAEELELTERVEEEDDDKGKAKGETDGDDDGGEEEGEDKGDKKPRSKPAHQRIGELTAARREAERRAEAAERELQALKGGKGGGDDGKSGAEADADLKEPKPDDFEFGEADPQYLLAMVRHDAAVERQAERREAQANEVKTQFREAMTGLNENWNAQAEKAVEKYPDFAETVLESAAAGEWLCGPVMSICISESEVGADVAYHLATNPEEAARIDKMHPMQQAMAFGRLEAQFAGDSKGDEGKPKPKIATDAPTPPKHTARGGGGKFEVDDDTEDFGAFEAKVMKGKK